MAVNSIAELASASSVAAITLGASAGVVFAALGLSGREPIRNGILTLCGVMGVITLVLPLLIGSGCIAGDPSLPRNVGWI